ncbi:MAG: hypothetical protein QUS14_03100 [Pyrinomonadaceae bacterium]|nr:hypothetical protein [Pyrinomonadaceae bacterium]
MFTSTDIKDALTATAKLLTFRLSREEFERFNGTYLLVGIVITWIVGMGRWWDDPEANILQHLGLGSVVYIFALAGILWFVIVPLRAVGLSYKHLLTFIALTSPPAIPYAIPVERFTDLATARSLNVWFLAIVALWRVALLLFYLKRHVRLSLFTSFITALLPIMAIVATLTLLNLERAVFDVMGGLREPGTPDDSAYAVLFLLTFFSTLAFIPVLAIYMGLIIFGKRDE